MTHILFYAFVLSGLGLSVVDSMLLREIWRLNPAWAEARQIPRHSSPVRSQRVRNWTWMKLVMSFNRELQITPLTQRQAIVSGVLHYIICLCVVVFIGVAVAALVSKY